jgi:ribonuclease Z
LEQLRWDYVRRFYEYLANPETVAKVLAETRPRAAVLSHISLYSRGDIPRATEDELTARIRAGYDGPFIIGQDLMSFVVSKDGVRQAPYSPDIRHREPAQPAREIK